MTDNRSDDARRAPGERWSDTGRPGGSGSGPGGELPGLAVARPRPEVTLRVEVAEEQYAPDGAREILVLLGVSVLGLHTGAFPQPADRTEVIVIDCSGSMLEPLHKMGDARRAAADAIALLPDGTHFALVQGTSTARIAYPATGAPGTVPASATSRDAGARAAQAMDAYGGTRIAAWLELVRHLLASRPQSAFHHVLLLTDGKDEHGERGELSRVLDACAPVFTCDVLGIGTDWDAAQLLEIAGRLGGRAQAVAPPDAGEGNESALRRSREEVAEVFGDLVRSAVRRALPGLTLRVSPQPYLTVVGLRQINPTLRELTSHPAPEGAGQGPGIRRAFPTGAWGEESRWYELRLRSHPGHADHPPAGRTVPIATVAVDAEGVRLPTPRPITVRWVQESPPQSNTAGVSTHFRRYGEMNGASIRGCAALGREEVATAVRELGHAVRLAHLLGDSGRLAQLSALVVVEDAAAGRVRLRERPDPAGLQGVLVDSSRTAAPPSQHPSPPVSPSPSPSPETASSSLSDGRPVVCPRPECGQLVPSGRYCAACGRPLGAG